MSETPRTFKEWWHERGGNLPHDATRKEVANIAWAAAKESTRSLERELAAAKADNGELRADLKEAIYGWLERLPPIHYQQDRIADLRKRWEGK